MPYKLERPRYFPSRKAYYVQLDGKQVKLASGPDDAPDGPTYRAALKAFTVLMEHGKLDIAGDDNTVKAIFNEYLTKKESKVRPKTWKIKTEMLSLFVAKYGSMKAGQVKSTHAENIADEMRKPRHTGKRVHKWGDAQCVIFFRQLSAAFAWCVRKELITRNPMLALEMPSLKTRSRERVITPAEHEKVLASLTKRRQQRIRRVIIALENTGARPSELIDATVADFDPANDAIVYYGDNVRLEDEKEHKTSYTDKSRVIYFTDEAREMVRSLCAGRKPTDYIFMTNDGNKYELDALDACFRVIRGRTGLPHFVPYAYRHSIATAWLKQGKSIELLATLLGNTADTIRRNYSHLIHEHDTLRRELEAFRQSGK